MSASDFIIGQRREKLEELRRIGIDPFFNRFKPSHTLGQIIQQYGGLNGPELEELGLNFKLSGRLILIREFGKASFCHLQDGSGERLQAYLQRHVVGEEAFALFKKLDLGDIVGFEGTLFRKKPRSLPWR